MYDRALKLIRQYHRLSQAELADSLNLSRSFVSELEKSGGKKPSIDVLERYASHFKIPVSSLLLFAERSGSSDLRERSRTYAADKVLKMLEWLEETTNDETGTQH
ncbi:helix-turn-helix transcriptional regulator [Bradyrhizobium sp. Ai1a-2]|uniref:helix-turn-helix domain-containing protein n=1 Tax=Bradyrhizobium sp. Ai1a-2 TaxID=196490 RepID=UPI0004283A7A|nr:helix-turn-helix transcriptional regulator [Bradyrhizobium sp. Ai1a-2]